MELISYSFCFLLYHLPTYTKYSDQEARKEANGIHSAFEMSLSFEEVHS